MSDNVYFIGRFAVTCDDECKSPDTAFDLQERSWRSLPSGPTMTFADAEARIRSMVDQTVVRLKADSEASAKRFVDALVSPKLVVEETPGALVLRTSEVRYKIVGVPAQDPEISKRFFAYDRLNAYQKALMPGQLPPYLQLAVSSELEARKLFPKAIDFTARVEKEMQTITIRCELEMLNAEQVAAAQRNLRNAGMSW